MTAKRVVRLYDRLSSEERFRLMLAALERDDQREHDRLSGSSRRILVEIPDILPRVHAFNVVALEVLLELIEDARRCDYAREHAFDPMSCDADHAAALHSPDAMRDAQPRPRPIAWFFFRAGVVRAFPFPVERKKAIRPSGRGFFRFGC